MHYFRNPPMTPFKQFMVCLCFLIQCVCVVISSFVFVCHFLGFFVFSFFVAYCSCLRCILFGTLPRVGGIGSALPHFGCLLVWLLAGSVHIVWVFFLSSKEDRFLSVLFHFCFCFCCLSSLMMFPQILFSSSSSPSSFSFVANQV